MNSFRNLPHPPEGLEPVKKMLLQELMRLAIVAKLTAALLKVLDPVETCVLDFRRKASLNLTSLNVDYKHAGST